MNFGDLQNRVFVMLGENPQNPEFFEKDEVERYIKLKNGEHIKVEEQRFSDELKLTATKEVARYVSPQLKAIEHTADGEGFGLTLHMNLGAAKKGNGAKR